MSSHDYKGHTIRVDTLEGARPWAVWVDGALVYGAGVRVRRRLAFSTPAAALDAGKKHVRALLRRRAEPNVAAQQHDQKNHDHDNADGIGDLVAHGRTGEREHQPNDQQEHKDVDEVEVHGAKPTPRPSIHDCGCSRHKVDAGRCDIYAPGGQLRSATCPDCGTTYSEPEKGCPLCTEEA